MDKILVELEALLIAKLDTIDKLIQVKQQLFSLEQKKNEKNDTKTKQMSENQI